MNWISVKERLPNENGVYLVSIKLIDGDVTTILYFKNGSFDFINNIACTHWMPLPEPVKDE
jgi:Protein of unknown function (DUF551)